MKKLNNQPWLITNYVFEENERGKLLDIIQHYYDKKRIELMSREISNYELDELEKWELTNKSLKDIEFLVTHSKSYKDDGLLIESVLSNSCYKDNKDKNIVALKASFIDLLNSTNIGKQKSRANLSKISENIIQSNFDNYFVEYNPIIVEKLAFSGSAKIWSFASKYVVYHNRHAANHDDYAIIDRVVKENLYRYDKHISKKYFSNMFSAKKDVYFTKYKNGYDTYVKTIRQLLKNSNINVDNPLRLFDHFIWWQFKDFKIKNHKNRNKF